MSWTDGTQLLGLASLAGPPGFHSTFDGDYDLQY